MIKKIRSNKLIYFSFRKIRYLIAISLYFFLNIIVKKEEYFIFESFYGSEFRDSPKAIYDNLAEKNKNTNSKYYLLKKGKHRNKFDGDLILVKWGSLKHLYLLAKCKYWISNSTINYVWNATLSSKNHVYINTWHGIPIKYLGYKSKSVDTFIKKWYENTRFDYISCCGEYDKKIFKEVFPKSPKSGYINGLPRNDKLFEMQAEISQETVNLINKIDKNKKILLYAPTFRDKKHLEDTKGIKNYIPELSEAFSEEVLKELSKKFTVLYRGHYIANSVTTSDSIINVSEYTDLNDLFKISDVLLTDYSSILFDYSVTEKPIVLFPYDYEEYSNNRGMYLDIHELDLPIVKDEYKLIEFLEKAVVDGNSYNIKEKYQTFSNGNSTKEVVRLLLNE